jgi:hypothetical protein
MKLHRPRPLARLIAALGGFFWLLCPVCRRHFGGHEWDMTHSIPDPDRPGMRRGVCSAACAREGGGTS